MVDNGGRIIGLLCLLAITALDQSRAVTGIRGSENADIVRLPGTSNADPILKTTFGKLVRGMQRVCTQAIDFSSA